MNKTEPKKGSKADRLQQVVNMLSEKLFVGEDTKSDVEKREEEIHQDLDGDNEEGESLEHKKKVRPKLF